MGQRGPAPKPTHIRLVEGKPGHHRPIHADEPVPNPGRPSCPEFLDVEAKREWGRTCKELERMGILASSDRAALAFYCQLWSDARRYTLKLAKEGETYETPWGQWCKRPEVDMRVKAIQQMKGLLAEFGLTPASRSRIRTGATSGDARDPMEGYLD